MSYKFLSTILGINANFTGRLGVGTTTPGYPLEVTGTAPAVDSIAMFTATNPTEGLGIYNSASSNPQPSLRLFHNTSSYRIWLYGSGNLAFVNTWNGGTPLYNFFGSGNFGIGVGFTDAGYKLDVNGTGRIQSNFEVGAGGSSLQGVKVIPGSYPSLQFWETVMKFSLDREGNNGLSFSSVNGFCAHMINTGTLIGGTSRYDLNSSAQLQVESTTRGFLQPRMTTTQRNAIATPATGLSIYNTTTNTEDYYNGSAWVSLQTSITNPVTGTGTTNYLSKWTSSSTLNTSLVYDNGTNVGIGTTSPGQKLDVAGTAKVSGISYLIGGLLVSNYGSTIAGGQSISGSGAGNYDFNNGSGGGWYFNWIQNGATAMRLSSGNNLLIGTTTDAGFRLDVNGTGRVQTSITIGGAADGTLFFPNTTSGHQMRIYTQYASNAMVLFANGFNLNLNGAGSMTSNFCTTITGSNGSAALTVQQGNVAWSPVLVVNAIGSTGTRFNTNGNVLIGTTTDAGQKLQLAGNQATTLAGSGDGFTLTRTGTYDNVTLTALATITDTTSNANRAKTGLYVNVTSASTNIAIQTVGAVGVGVTPPSNSFASGYFSYLYAGATVNSAANYNLNVRSTISSFAAGNGGGMSFWGDDRGQAGANTAFAGIRGVKENSTYLNGLGALTFLTQASSAGLSTESTFAEVGRFTSGGNFGIGTTTPSYKLDVNGTARATTVITDTITTSGSTTLASYAGTTYTYGPIVANPASFTFTFQSQPILYGSISSGYVPKANMIGMGNSLIYQSGSNNILINSTTDTGYKLQVDGNVNINTASTTNNLVVNTDTSMFYNLTSGGGQVKSNVYTTSKTTRYYVPPLSTEYLIEWDPTLCQGIFVDYVILIQGPNFIRSGTLVIANDNGGNVTITDNINSSVNGSSTAFVTFSTAGLASIKLGCNNLLAANDVYVNIVTRYIPNIY